MTGAATHAIILEDWQYDRTQPSHLDDPFSRVSFYNRDLISRIFACLRVVTGADLGYAQILVIPRGWARQYTAHLPPIEGTSIRAYPPWFDNYRWLAQVPTLTGEDLESVADTWRRLDGISKESVHLALRRINQCYMRESEEDLVIDATIALEALLASGENAELTHKLALRVAALSTLDTVVQKAPGHVFKETKAVYSHRSAIVHGSHRAQKKRIITSVGAKDPTSSVGLDYLRMSLRVLIRNQRYLDPAQIDEDLILGSMSTREEP